MKQIQSGDIRMAVELKGDTGIPLVLLHGFPLDHGMWRQQIDALSTGARVIAPDLRGFGQSELGSGAMTMERMADDIGALLDGLGIREPVVLAGFSMGGYVAFQFCKRFPDRVRGLILCDTRAMADSPEAAAGRVQTAAKVLEHGAGVTAEAMLPKMFGPRTVAANPGLVAQTRAMMLACSPAGIAAALQAMAARSDARALLPTLGVPCLILVGEHDAISSAAEMREIADAIPGAEYRVVAEAGHLLPLEKPAEVNAAIERFIGGLPAVRWNAEP